MGSGVRLGKILDFEIRLDYSWFLVFLMSSWIMATSVFPEEYGLNAPASRALGVAAALLLFASVLVHELSHAVVARKHGIEVAGITLFLFGGVAQIKGEPETPRSEFLIAGVGPLVSGAIGLACLGLAWGLAPGVLARPLAALCHYLGVCNLGLACFNMIPGFPLDGGRLLRSGIWRVTGSLRKATRWASNVGQAFGWLLVGYGLWETLRHHNFSGLWLVLVGWFLKNAARAAYQQLLLRRALRGVPLAEVMTHDIPQVDADIRIPEFVERYLMRCDYALYPVVREGELVGVVSVDDVRHLGRQYWGVTCVGALSHQPEQEGVLREDQDAWEAFTRILDTETSRLLVIRDGRLEGTVSRTSIIRLVQRKMRLGHPAERPSPSRAAASRTRGWAP